MELVVVVAAANEDGDKVMLLGYDDEVAAEDDTAADEEETAADEENAADEEETAADEEEMAADEDEAAATDVVDEARLEVTEQVGLTTPY